MRLSFVRRAVALGAAALLGAGLVAGCSPDKTGGDGGAAGGSGSATASAQDLDLNKPLVKATYTVPGTVNDTVTVGVLGLEAEGNLQVLQLAFTPKFASKASDQSISLYDMLGSYSFNPQLIDRENLKIYSVVGSFESSATSTETVNNRPVYVYAVFAKPEDANKTYDVLLSDSWQPITVTAPGKK